jgi:enamine deaminase RidA (YjgF/YER057c/UK114 family)
LPYSGNHLLSNEGTTIMIERIHVNERSSKIVKHNGVVYLTGQVAEGDTIQEQVRVCLQKIETLAGRGGIVERADAESDNLAC